MSVRRFFQRDRKKRQLVKIKPRDPIPFFFFNRESNQVWRWKLKRFVFCFVANTTQESIKKVLTRKSRSVQRHENVKTQGILITLYCFFLKKNVLKQKPVILSSFVHNPWPFFLLLLSTTIPGLSSFPRLYFHPQCVRLSWYSGPPTG